MPGPEAKIERKVCLDAKRLLGVESFKWGVDGWPDRGFLIPRGRPLFIEFKAPGEPPSPRQAERLACLQIWGYAAEVHDDYDRALQAISRALAAARLNLDPLRKDLVIISGDEARTKTKKPRGA